MSDYVRIHISADGEWIGWIWPAIYERDGIRHWGIELPGQPLQPAIHKDAGLAEDALRAAVGK